MLAEWTLALYVDNESSFTPIYREPAFLAALVTGSFTLVVKWLERRAAMTRPADDAKLTQAGWRNYSRELKARIAYLETENARLSAIIEASGAPEGK